MSDRDLLRSEVEHMSDRDILLEILAGQRTQNGAIAAIKGDYYGDPVRQIIGTKQTVEEHDRLIRQARTAFKTIVGLVSVLGVANVVVWLRVLASP